MTEINPTQDAIDARATVSAQTTSDSTGSASSSSSIETATFSSEQVAVVTQFACDIFVSRQKALYNDGSSSIPDHSPPRLSPPPPRWFEAHSQFSRPVANYLWHGSASDSWEIHRVGQESFIDFVRLHPAYLNQDGSILPATETAVIEWIAYLGARNVHSKALKSYLIDMRSLHADVGYPITVFESPAVQCLIRGIKHVHGECLGNPKLPITIDVLRQLCAATSSDGIRDITFKAAITVAFAAFLRVSEFTVATDASCHPALHLSRGSVKFFPDASSPTHFILSIPASNTDPFRQGSSILVAAAPGALTCPVAALKTLFERDPRPPSAPLFSGPTPGQPLTRDHFTLVCYIILSLSGIDIAKHSDLSFRRGAAASAEAVGHSEDEIRLLGRWRSDADKLYSEVPRERILELSARLHSTELPLRILAPQAA